MRVLYFGTYDASYPRNAQVISALRAAGAGVIERNEPVWSARHNWSAGIGQLARLRRAQRRLRTPFAEEADAIIVGYPGHFDLAAARRVARGRPVVFNALVSLYDTLVNDRRRFRRRSPAAAVTRRIDSVAFRGADLVVADTEAHAAFFAGVFGLPPERIAVCFVGAEDRLFEPGWRASTPFSALFVGKLIPLHGVETILAAARLAPEIRFRLVGSGQLGTALGAAPPNVEHIPWIDYEKLPDAYRQAGCALGIFGTSAKAGRVIPNKAFQALACGTPLVTADTPAARELLTEGHDALLVPSGSPQALAVALRRLAADRQLAERIGAAGRATYETRASEAVLGARWRELLEQLVASTSTRARDPVSPKSGRYAARA